MSKPVPFCLQISISDRWLPIEGQTRLDHNEARAALAAAAEVHGPHRVRLVPVHPPKTPPKIKAASILIVLAVISGCGDELAEGPGRPLYAVAPICQWKTPCPADQSPAPDGGAPGVDALPLLGNR